MGFWRTKRGRIGDSWADAMDDCMKKLETLKAKPYEDIGGVVLDSDDGSGYEITLGEFADLVEACTSRRVSVRLKDNKESNLPISQIYSNQKVAYIDPPGTPIDESLKPEVISQPSER